MRALLAGALAVVALAGCGRDTAALIPPAEAQALDASLQQVEVARADGRCDDARAAAVQARDLVRDLPDTVDPELRRRLRSGVSRVFELLPDQCADAPAETAPVETAPPETTAPETTPETPPEDTTPADTAPPATTAPTTATPTTPAVPTTPAQPGTGGDAAPEEDG